MNILSPFEYFAPETKEEAVKLLAELPNVKVLAGGTDLVIQLKEKLVKPENIVNINNIAELKGITIKDGDGAEIGACTTLATCEFSKELIAKYPAFAYACGELGGPQVREMGTVGGNLSHSSPAAETPASLIAYGAVLELYSVDGTRTLPVADFIHGNRKNDLKAGEIITKIILPEPKANTVVKYGYVGLRKSMEIDCANMAVSLTVEDGTITAADCIMGSVFIKPIVSEAVPKVLVGNKLTDELIKAAGEAAVSEVNPITDVRATAEYRKDVIGALARRLVKEAYAELTK